MRVVVKCLVMEDSCLRFGSSVGNCKKFVGV